MQRTLVLAAVAAVLSSTVHAQGTPPSPKPQPSPSPAAAVAPEESTLYALGVSVGKGLVGFSLSPTEAASVMKGIADALAEKAGGVDLDAARPKIRALAESRASVRLEKEKGQGKAFRDEAAKAAGAVVLPSGLVYVEKQAGVGDAPAATDTVKVQYRGTLVDGTEFDSSAKRAEPASFALNRVIPCWTEGIQKMKPGGKARLVCPSEIAYGDSGRRGIPAGATLVFDVELLEIVKPASPEAPKAPAPSPLPKP